MLNFFKTKVFQHISTMILKIRDFYIIEGFWTFCLFFTILIL